LTLSEGEFQQFAKTLTDYFRKAQDRSLIATIGDWTKNSQIPSPAILVDSEAFFLRARWEQPDQAKFARFATEVYACIDQLITTLILLSAEFYRASRRTKAKKQKLRCECMAEIFKCLSTHLQAMRTMAISGFHLHLKQIARPYGEYIELMSLICRDESALDEFVAANNSASANHFWYTQLRKSKARKTRVTNFAKFIGTEHSRKQTLDWYERETTALSESVHPSLEVMVSNGQLVFFSKDGLPRIKSTYPGDSIFSLHFAFSNFSEAIGSGEEIIQLVHRHLGSGKSGGSMRQEIVERFYMLIFLGPLLNYRREMVILGSSSLEEDIVGAQSEPDASHLA